MRKLLILFLLFPFTAFATNCANNTTFNIGTGIYDITGPAAEAGMMGYGMLRQKTAGIYQRLWARAFIIESACNNKRLIIVNADLGQLFQGVKQQVIIALQKKYGDLYSDDNVLLTATHTHSGPGAYSHHFFYNITTLGFDHRNFDTIVNGIVTAIDRAIANMQPGKIKVATGELTGISYNRSPTAYQENPSVERNQYQHDVDTQMTLLRFETLSGKPIGMINWFAIHGTSMNNKNLLINGDNKGYAEYLFEKDFQSDHGFNSFVAAFAQSNAGDVSPNKDGLEGSAGLDGLAAVERAGKPQYEKAKELFVNARELLQGEIDYRHEFVSMDGLPVDPIYTGNTPKFTCSGAIGVSMLAGTTDGEGFGYQGVTCANISSVLPQLACDMTTSFCQGVKPIALSTGKIRPWPWTPNVLPLQVVKIGNFIIAAAPVELTTMSGRRIRASIKQQLANEHVVLAALSNAYAGYVATYEEYQLQRYEGASTHFGPYTLAALQQEFVKLTKAMQNNEHIVAGPTPPDLSGAHLRLRPGVLYDSTPSGMQFGSVSKDVKSQYHPGDTVEVVFWGAHPRNDFRTQDTFLAVEQLINGEWKKIRDDNDWDTAYHWERNGLANSLVTIEWRIPKNMSSGQYRIVHYGNWKALLTRKITSYVGYSSAFTIA